MQRNRILCIDLGSDTIKAAIGIKNAERIEVIAATSVPVQGVVCGVVTNVERCTQAFKKIFYTLKARETDFVVVGLSNYYIESTKSIQSKYIAENAKIREEDLDGLFEKAENAYLKEELELLDVFLQYYNVDEIRGIQNPIGMRGVKMEATYNIFSCRKTFLGNIEQCINRAGFQVGDFVFSSYYNEALLFNEEDKESGVLVLDLGADVTRASVFVDDALYTSFAVPFGSRSVTIDIKNSYPVTLRQAENLKRQFSCALAELAEENAAVAFQSSDVWGERSLRVSELAGVVQCRLDEICLGIRYQLRKMALEDLIETVILIGGGASQNCIKSYMEKCFQVPVKLATIQPGVFEEVPSLSALFYGNVLGMLHYELSEGSFEEQNTQDGFFWRIAGGFRSFFGRKNAGEDAKM